METFLTATLLIAVGATAAFCGYLVFRILLPILGLVVGFMVGFSGVQALFGTDVWSTTIAVISGVAIGLLFAALSYFYYFLAMVILGASIGGGAMSFFAHALGLSDTGFLTFLLSLSGAIIGGVVVLAFHLEKAFVVYLSAFAGVALVFTGLFLAIGGLTLTELHEEGVRTAFDDHINGSFFWILAWLGGSLSAAVLQHRVALYLPISRELSLEDELGTSLY